MAKTRYIKTTFRSDNYIENLDPSEKLLFLYFLTNEHTDLCGIYEISLKKISFETGFDKSMIEKIIDRFSKDGKVYFFDGYVFIKNFQKHQKNGSVSIDQGIQRSISKIPQEVLDKIHSIGTLPPPPIECVLPIPIPIPIPKLIPTPEIEILNVGEFDSFWKQYPRKKGKGKAKEAYEKMIKSGKATHEQIMKGLDQYKRELALHQSPPNFIKRPQGWLNEARREDEYSDGLPAFDDYEARFPILDKEASTPTGRPKIDWIANRSGFPREQASDIYQKRKFYLKQKAIGAER